MSRAPNQSPETNRRTVFATDPEGQFGDDSCVPRFRSSAFAHL